MYHEFNAFGYISLCLIYLRDFRSISNPIQMQKPVIDKGNYRGYYKFRGEADKRINSFSGEWFDGKVCLDIGCNEGLVTLEIAKRFAPTSILGIDADKILIESAQSKLKRIIYEQQQQQSAIVVSKTSVTGSQSKPVFGILVPRAVMQKQPAQCRIPIKTTPAPPVPKISSSAYPYNIQFVHKSFMELSHPTSSAGVVADGKYDTVLCLSVVKWIHLNEGDAGLMAFFRKLFQLVRFGGRVVFEFQPWKSYLNNKAVNERIKANFAAIAIRPEHFERILVQEVGFVLEGCIGTPLEEARGFDRPIFILRRPVPSGGATGGAIGNCVSSSFVSGSGSADTLSQTAADRVSGNSNSSVNRDSTVSTGSSSSNSSRPFTGLLKRMHESSSSSSSSGTNNTIRDGDEGDEGDDDSGGMDVVDSEETVVVAAAKRRKQV